MDRDEEAKVRALVDEFNTYIANKDVAGAEKFLERSLESVKKSEGEASISMAKCYLALGTFYFGQEKYHEAVNVTRKALEIFESRFPADHQAVSLAQTNLGLYLCPTGQIEEAEQLLLKASASNKRKRPNTSDNGQTLHNLALLYRNNKRWKEAEETYESALVVWTKNNDKHLLSTLKDFAQMYHMKGDIQNAKKTLKRAHEAAVKIFKNKNHDVCLQIEKEIAEIGKQGQGASTSEIKSDAGGRVRGDEMTR